MKHFSRGIVLKALLIAVSVAVMGMIAGCTSGLAEPFDLNNLFFEYDTVSGSDGQYIIITKHIASQSDVKIPDASESRAGYIFKICHIKCQILESVSHL